MAFSGIVPSRCSPRGSTPILRQLATVRHFSAVVAGGSAGETVFSTSRTATRATQLAPVEAEQHIRERADVLGLRLSHENTYLSWSRNGIIATVAAVGIHSVTADENFSAGQTSGCTATSTVVGSCTWPIYVTPPAAAMFGVAGTFFSFGTVQYIAQLSQLARLLQLTPLRKAWMAAHALGAAGFWVLGVRALMLHQPRVKGLLPGRPDMDPLPSLRAAPASAVHDRAGDYTAPAALVVSAVALLALINGLRTS